MEKFNEKVATLNATTIMAERMLDLLTNHTRITDYEDRADIEITTDFANGCVEVNAGDFTITYYISDTPNIKFDKKTARISSLFLFHSFPLVQKLLHKGFHIGLPGFSDPFCCGRIH